MPVGTERDGDRRRTRTRGALRQLRRGSGSGGAAPAPAAAASAAAPVARGVEPTAPAAPVSAPHVAARCRIGGPGRRSCRRSCAGSRRSTGSTSPPIAGTGTGGRITKKDVLAAVAGGRRPSPRHRLPRRARGAGPGGARAAPPAAARGEDGRADVAHPQGDRAAHARLGATRPARAWTMVEVNVDHLVRLRERAKDAFAREARREAHVPAVWSTRATTDALLAFPMVNSRARRRRHRHAALREHGDRRSATTQG